MNDLSDLSDKKLADEFHRLWELKEKAEQGMKDIRFEQGFRKDQELKRLQAKLDAIHNEEPKA